MWCYHWTQGQTLLSQDWSRSLCFSIRDFQTPVCRAMESDFRGRHWHIRKNHNCLGYGKGQCRAFCSRLAITLSDHLLMTTSLPLWCALGVNQRPGRRWSKKLKKRRWMIVMTIINRRIWSRWEPHLHSMERVSITSFVTEFLGPCWTNAERTHFCWAKYANSSRWVESPTRYSTVHSWILQRIIRFCTRQWTA